MNWMKLFVYFGHGRLLELYLSVLKLLVGLNVITVSQSKLDEAPAALWDLFWYIPQPAIAAPFFIIGFIQLTGLIMNYKGVEGSWIFRYIGALGAIGMWSWLIYKSLITGEVHTWLFSLALVSMPFSMLLAWKAWHRLPIPGMKYQAWE
jgi:hypothetical protein